MARPSGLKAAKRRLPDFDHQGHQDRQEDTKLTMSTKTTKELIRLRCSARLGAFVSLVVLVVLVLKD